MQGNQRPRIVSFPGSTSSVGAEAVQLAREAGLVLDEWQAFVLEHALGRRGSKWAAFEVGLVVPRQNGKGSILEARELAGLFLLRERLIVHSAHQFDTSLEAFRRLLFLVEDNPDFSRRVKRVSRSHGEEGIELTNRQRIRFRTRTKGGGRGFSGDCVIFDEAMIFPEASHGAILPILSARPDPQAWYTGSAVDQDIHEDGLVLARVRERGIAGDDDGLAYFEWSVDAANPDDVTKETAKAPEAWGTANPGLGIRIDADYVDKERKSLAPRTFAVERLGVGDWPDLQGEGAVVPIDLWLELTDPNSKPVDPVCFAFDVTPDRKMASIGLAALTPDGLDHLEVVEERRGTGWVVPRIAELASKWSPLGVVYDGGAAGAALKHELEEAGIIATAVTSRQYAEACGLFYDGADQRTIRHLGTSDLVSALRVAVKRNLGDAWVWDRRTSSVNITSLVAVTLALWGSKTLRAEPFIIGF